MKPKLSVILIGDAGPAASDEGSTADRDVVGNIVGELEVLRVPLRPDSQLRTFSSPVDRPRHAATGFDDLATAFEAATAPWVMLARSELGGRPLSVDVFGAVLAALESSGSPVQCIDLEHARDQSRVADEFRAPSWQACVFDAARIEAAGLRADETLEPSLAAEVLLWRVLARFEEAVASALLQRAQAATSEPTRVYWRVRENYGHTIERAFLAPLLEATRLHGKAPRWMQSAVLEHLHWYFTVDGRERAPTVIVDEALAERFHTLVGQIMQQIEWPVIETVQGASPEILHTLASYQGLTLTSGHAIDRFDHAQRLARLSYWIHGAHPQESVRIAGREAAPVFSKIRACKYFRRHLLSQRIAWFDAGESSAFELTINGKPIPVNLGAQSFCGPTPPAADPSSAKVLARARQQFSRGKAALEPLPSGPAAWKARCVKALARTWPVGGLYRDAWVFTDRDENADDNAEHLYRWVRRTHPRINAWFLLHRDSPDWPRLEAEGFRLMPPGIRRRLLLLNATHIASSHADLVHGGFDPGLYGDAMRWRYTFLQHGVTKDDVSHWLGPREFDCFVTASPAEHESIVGDSTPYPYTDREARRTGFPRHDRLLRLAREVKPAEPRYLLVMPTWRGSLVDDRAGEKDPAAALAAFAASEYASRWRSLLNASRLHSMVSDAKLKVLFMPHHNAAPFLQAFRLPPGVEVFASSSSGTRQMVFARTAVFITDYTSVAFDLALLRRPMLYYQFDRTEFYSGGHNWRPGYFDNDRDGFGPVVYEETDLLTQLEHILNAGCSPSEAYRRRMERAMPDLDGLACQRTYEAMLSLDKPLGSSRPHASGRRR